MVQPTDAELLRDHLAGHPQAFADLAQRYADELYSFMFRFVNSAAVAEDLVQETLIQVHHSAASFDMARPLRPWVYTIAANKARDYLRGRGRRPMQSLDAGADEDRPDGAQQLEAGGPSASEMLDDAEQRARVRAIVAELPEHHREVLLLGYFQQLPYAEIAEILDVPLGTVKSRLHAAVKNFGEQWKRFNGMLPDAH